MASALCGVPIATAQTTAQTQEAAPAPPPRLRLDTWSLPIERPASGAETKAPRIETNLGGVCPSCSVDPLRPWRSSDPWWIESRIRFDRPGGGFSAGVVGRRNAVLPLFASIPLGGGAYQPPVASSATTNFETSNIDWNLTIGVRRRLLTTSGGATLDFAADAIAPIATGQEKSGSVPHVKSKSLRIGAIWRP